MATAKRKSHPANEITLRHLWLAGLGLAAVARREALGARLRVLEQVREVRASLRGQVEPQVVKFSQDVEARLAPVLDKLGLKKAAKARKPRKAATRAKAPSRRTARKTAAKRTARKA